MYKYIIKNNLNTFNFHDAYIKQMKQKNNDMIWIVDALNIKKECPLNKYSEDMQIDNVQIIFKNSTINYIKDSQNNEEVLLNKEEINNIINYFPFSQILSFEEHTKDENNRYTANFLNATNKGIYTINISFDKVDVYFNQFSHAAYYTGEKYREIIIQNIDKLHITKLGEERVKRNLSINAKDVLKYLKETILNYDSQTHLLYTYKKGKNVYVKTDEIVITININSYTIITAHKIV